MELKFERIGNIALVELAGKNLDATNADTFKQEIAPLLERSSKAVFDMSQLEFIDSSGLGAIFSCFKNLKAAGGNLTFFGVSEPIQAFFELVRMNRIFGVFATRDEALKALE